MTSHSTLPCWLQFNESKKKEKERHNVTPPQTMKVVRCALWWLSLSLFRDRPTMEDLQSASTPSTQHPAVLLFTRLQAQ